MVSRDTETANWLHNKLGSTDDLWSGRSICSQLTRERLQDIVGCFRSLQPHVKVKLLLSSLHIRKRELEEWKSDLEELIELAVTDRDPWVSTVGEILKTYPATFLVNSTDLSGSSTFHSMHNDLKKIVKKSGESNTLPLECMCLGKTALNSVVSNLPSNKKHFSLKRKPKSASLRADLLVKSQEIQSATKKGLPTSSIPMKVRSTAKRMDEELAAGKPSFGAASKNGGVSAAGFLKANTLSSFNNTLRQSSTLAMRKEGGAKMLDISEMPPTSKEAKRRKKQEELEAKKEKEEAAAAAAAAEKAAAAAAAAVKATPDYAAGLGSNTGIKTVMPGAPRTPAAQPYLQNVVPKPPSSGLPASYHPSYYYQHYMMSYMNHSRNYLPAHCSGYVRELSAPGGGPQPMNPGASGTLPLAASLTQRLAGPPTQHIQPQIPVANQLPSNTGVQPVAMSQTQPAVQLQTAQQQNPAAGQPGQPQKKTLSLTKELMLQAQEMFRNSNKVSRPEKALILGFMAGSRDNPCPGQGHIVNIRLNEDMETVRLPDNSVRQVMVETFFQMNYQTGDWKKIKKPKDPINLLPGVTQVK